MVEASEVLGVTVEAVRGRIKRGTLRHERDSGTVYVLLDVDQSQTGHQPDDDQTTDQARSDDDIVGELRDRIRYLERQVEAERESRRRADTILAQLSAANAEQARTIRALEAPQEAPEEAETVEEAPEEGHATAAREARDDLGVERARREMAESTLHEGMAEERRRREDAERERDDLRQELYVLRRPREAAETVEEDLDRAEPHPAAAGAQEGTEHQSSTLQDWSDDVVEARRRPWWRRVFGR